MQNEMNELFLLALRFFYKEYKKKGGSQGQLAEKLGVTNSYLSSVTSGARKASLELQTLIAKILYGPYDKFLSIGRRIKDGLEPLEIETKKPDDPVEKLLAHLTHYVMDHKRIEKDLKLSEEKFRDISLTSGDMIFELNSNLVLTYVSGRVKEVVGRSGEELVGRKFSDFLDDEELARLQNLVQESIQKQSIINTVLTVLQGGKTKYRHIIAKPVFSPDEKFLGFRGTYRDITKRKNLERELEQQNWLLQVALDSVEHCGIVISDAQNRVLKWNNKYKTMFGHTAKVLETRNTLKYIEKTRNKVMDIEQFDRDVAEALESKKEIIHTFRLKNGRTIQRKVLPMFKDGILVGRITHLKDITPAGAKTST